VAPPAVPAIDGRRPGEEGSAAGLEGAAGVIAYIRGCRGYRITQLLAILNLTFRRSGVSPTHRSAIHHRE